MSTLSVWSRRDPFAELDTLVRTAFGPPAGRSGTAPAAFSPAAELDRDGDDAIVRLELPGVDVDDVTVEVDDGQLTVRGERRDERSDNTAGGRLHEVRYGAFRRSFDLPAHVGDDAVTATYDAGVLTVRVAGAYAGVQARRIPVTATAPAIESVEERKDGETAA
jgi:HSP20 family molecular chaperone IbpA